MNNIELVLIEKEKELELLRQEMDNALVKERLDKGDNDFIYASQLYPIIENLKQEISRLKSLQQSTEHSNGDSFPSYITQMLAGGLHSLELHISLNHRFASHTGPILFIYKTKSKNTLECIIKVSGEIEQFISSNYVQLMEQIGWKAYRRNKWFKVKCVIKSTDHMESFHRLIARTLLEPFSGLIKHGKYHYHLFR